MFVQQPTHLTQDSVTEIINKNAFSGQSFVMQMLSITNNYLGHYYSQLSDGHCKIRCQFGPQVKLMAQNQKLLPYSIIRFNLTQFQLMQDNQNPSIILNQCQIIKSQLDKTIGSPMPYKLYKQKGFQNVQGSHLIQSGPRVSTIRQVLNNSRMKNCSIKGKAFNLPKNTKACMFMFKIVDPNNDEISAVGFQDIADTLYKQLQQGQQYIFSNFILQKNRKTNADQIKFKNVECVQPVINKNKSKSKTSGMDIQSHKKASKSQDENQINKPNIDPKRQDQTQKIWTKKQIYQLIKTNQTKQKFFDVIGKITYLNTTKPRFRKINIRDINNDEIDILLWEEIKQPVILEKIYKISNIRLKPNVQAEGLKYIQLHSSKKTSISFVEPVEFQLMCLKNKNNYPKYSKNNSKANQQPERPERTKKCPENIKLVTLADVIRFSQNQNNQQGLYHYVECYIKIRTQSFKYKDDDSNSYFNCFCGPCGKNVSITQGDNNQIFCINCKKDDIRLKFNFRVKIVDLHSQIPCSLQTQTTQRLLNIGTQEALNLYTKKKQQFQILLNKVNFQNRICKLQIRTKGLSKYFNILQVYAKDTKPILQQAHNNLLQMLKQFNNVQTKQQS